MEIYDVLKEEHKEVKKLMTELLSLSSEKSARRDTLIEQIRDALVPHSRAEEAVFYNSLRTVPGAVGKAWHGYEEHLEAETLLRTLQAGNLAGLEFKKVAEKLKTALDHHIQYEEGELFAAARREFSSEEATQMAEAFRKLSAEVRKQTFVGTTMDMVANMMPPRFTAAFRKFSWQDRKGSAA